MKLIFVDMPLRPISKNTIFNHQSISSTQGCYISAPLSQHFASFYWNLLFKWNKEGKEKRKRNTEIQMLKNNSSQNTELSQHRIFKGKHMEKQLYTCITELQIFYSYAFKKNFCAYITHTKVF